MNETARNRIQSRLSSELGRRDEQPNAELAEDLARRSASGEIGLLCDILQNGNNAVKGDAIKVLYEIGSRKPELIAPQINLFLNVMKSRNNRLVWGALTALAAIATVDPQAVHPHVGSIMNAADKGSVIARDQAVEILVNLKKSTEFAGGVTPVLFDRLGTAAVNQLPMYAERISAVLEPQDIDRFREILSHRLLDQMVHTKRKRIEKVLQRLPTAN